MFHAVQSSPAGIVNAFGSWFGGIALVISAIALYRKQRTTEAKVDAVHQLVDGNLTAAKVSERDATTRELVTLREVARLHTAAGHAVDPEAEAVIAQTARRIAELDSEIVERRARETQMASTKGN